MATMDSSGWGHHDQDLQSTAEDEFHQFFEMQRMSNINDGLNFDFQFSQGSSASTILPPPQREQMDTSMGGTDPSLTVPSTSGLSQEQMTVMTTGPSHPPVQALSNRMPPTPTDSITDIDAQIQYLQQQRLQQQHRQVREQQSTYYSGHNHRGVPPTPRSLDIQAGNAHFFSPTDTPIFDSRVRMNDGQQDMSFTPIVSPAMTPLEAQFNVDSAFVLPATYYSPISSPALHAQNDPNMFFTHHLQQSVVNSSNSPHEMDLETNFGQETAKKARKASSSKPSRKTNVRQSPITKPQRRKTTSSSIVTQVLNEAVEAHSRTNSPNMTGSRRDDVDDNSSVSPEALSDMPPPPLPAPKGSKAANGMQRSTSASRQHAPLPLSAMPSPATPASLMKLAPSSSSSSNALKITSSPGGFRGGQVSSEPSETMFQLPDSAAGLDDEHVSPLDYPVHSHPVIADSNTRDSNYRGTPSLQAMSSPSFGNTPGTVSASQSPMLGPHSTTPTARRTPQLAPRGSKKRQGSMTASPALLPRISPSIKPLLPGGAGDDSFDDAASMLLTTKSNYQNILEGNKVPGVSYPTSLSTNLSSKRTSHKIAEQGRRNRINTALQEIAALLPAALKDAKDCDDAEEKRNPGAPSSKASTVEMAIDYIKQLRQEVADAKRRADDAERRLGMGGGAAAARSESAAEGVCVKVGSGEVEKVADAATN